VESGDVSERDGLLALLTILIADENYQRVRKLEEQDQE
jgi:hypothetical protein